MRQSIKIKLKLVMLQTQIFKIKPNFFFNHQPQTEPNTYRTTIFKYLIKFERNFKKFKRFKNKNKCKILILLKIYVPRFDGKNMQVHFYAIKKSMY